MGNKELSVFKCQEIIQQMKTARSIYTGVSLSFDPVWLNAGLVRWESRITINGITHSLGSYKTEWEAAESYNKKAISLGRKISKRNINFEYK